MEEIRKSAKTVDDAIAAALAELGAAREEVDITVIDEGSKGFLGRISRIIPSSMIREPFSKGVSCSPHKIIPAFNMVRFMSVCFLRLSISFVRLSLNQQLPLAGFRSPPVQGQECLQLCRELHSICGIPWTARIPAAGKARL